MNQGERLQAGDVDRDGELPVANLARRGRVGTSQDGVVAPHERTPIDGGARDERRERRDDPELEELTPVQEGALARILYRAWREFQPQSPIPNRMSRFPPPCRIHG